MTNWPVTLTLIDTYYGDQSRDKVILKKQILSDVNGNFDFEYSFPKENYYDVELTLKDAQGKIQTTGFLVQPRVPKTSVFDTEKAVLISILGIILGVTGALFVIKFKKTA